MSVDCKMEHFHTVVTPLTPIRVDTPALAASSSIGFVFSVHYQVQLKKKPPLPRALCISCDVDNEVSKCSMLKQSTHNRLWIDAKGNCMMITTLDVCVHDCHAHMCHMMSLGRASFVVTPLAHVEHFNQISDASLLALYGDCFDVLEEEAIAAGIAVNAAGLSYPIVVWEQMVATQAMPCLALPFI